MYQFSLKPPRIKSHFRTFSDRHKWLFFFNSLYPSKREKFSRLSSGESAWSALFVTLPWDFYKSLRELFLGESKCSSKWNLSLPQEIAFCMKTIVDLFRIVYDRYCGKQTRYRIQNIQILFLGGRLYLIQTIRCFWPKNNLWYKSEIIHWTFLYFQISKSISINL